MNRRGQWGEIAALGTAQTLAWASSYYLPAILAQPIAAELGLPAYGLFAAFSMALLVSAAVGPFAGKLIDRRGGRPVLLASNLIFACGLTLLSQSHGVAGLALAWMVIGVAMGSGLYEAAFSTLVKLHGKDSRNAITGITLIAGFASTVGWPLTMYLESSFGWRDTCLIWAALHVLLGLPLNARLRPMSRETARPIAPPGSTGAPASGNRRSQFLLAYVFAVSWFISTAMAAHMPGLLAQNGVPLLTAVFIAGLVGPAQVAGRLLEFSLLRRIHPLASARLAAIAHPIGVLVLLSIGAQGSMAFALLHGLGNGILTIAVGTLPLVLFGAQGYGYRQGLLLIPSRVMQAGAPFAFGLLSGWWGADALWVSAGLGLSAAIALLFIEHRVHGRT